MTAGSGDGSGVESSASGTVLVVDDEEPLVELYATWLRGEWTVRTATSGSGALEALDESVDVVLLDRDMPGVSGDEVLARIRERDLDTVVCMLTAIEPAVSVVDLPFDDYVCKPVSAEELRSRVSDLVARSQYHRALRAQFARVSKLALLESRHDRAALEGHEEYQQLVLEVEDHDERLRERIEQLSEPETAYLDLA